MIFQIHLDKVYLLGHITLAYAKFLGLNDQMKL